MNEDVHSQKPEQTGEQSEQKNFLEKFIKFNKTLWLKLSISQKIYYVGIWCGFFTLLVYLTIPKIYFYYWMLLTMSVVLIGSISDIIHVYNRVWETSLGKGFILVFYALLANFAYAISSQIVNNIINFPSDSLLYTLNFVAILSIPFFAVSLSVIVLTAFILVTHFLAVTLFFIYLISPKHSQKISQHKTFGKYFKTTIFIRLIAYSMVVGTLTGISSSFFPSYDRFISQAAKKFLFVFEAKKHSRCQLEEEQKAIEINDDEIIIASKINNRYTFKPQLCKPRLFSENQLGKRD